MEITASENFNAVQKITQIAKKLEDSAISDEVMVEIKDDLEGLSEYLEATPQQSMLFFIMLLSYMNFLNWLYFIRFWRIMSRIFE